MHREKSTRFPFVIFTCTYHTGYPPLWNTTEVDGNEMKKKGFGGDYRGMRGNLFDCIVVAAIS